MSGLEPFSPDAEYCVYCHAPAAGACAGCQAICCADCVDLVMGLTTQTAVCHSCLAQGWAPPGLRSFSRATLALAASLVVVLLLLYFIFLAD